MNRVSWIDYAKGIGIILVVYGHVLRGINSAQMGLSKDFFDISDKIVYGFHMPLFFFLSGLFAEKWLKKGFLDGMIQKTKTLICPYLVWCIIQGSIMIVLSSYTNSRVSWNSIPKIVYQPIEQFWFLYVLFLIFLLYYVIRKILNIRLLLMVSLVTYIFGQFFNFWLIDNVVVNLFFFSLGVLFMEYQIKLEKISTLTSSLLVFLLLNYIYVDFTFHAMSLVIMQLFIALSGILFIISLSMVFAKINKLTFLKYLGSFSMTIYLVHILAGSGFRIILLKISHVNSVYIHIVGGVIAGILLPIIFYKVVKLIKLNSFVFGEFKDQVANRNRKTRNSA